MEMKKSLLLMATGMVMVMVGTETETEEINPTTVPAPAEIAGVVLIARNAQVPAQDAVVAVE
jgi:hypothetical protein